MGAERRGHTATELGGLMGPGQETAEKKHSQTRVVNGCVTFPLQLMVFRC